jgi:hypothetical protein
MQRTLVQITALAVVAIERPLPALVNWIDTAAAHAVGHSVAVANLVPDNGHVVMIERRG